MFVRFVRRAALALAAALLVAACTAGDSSDDGDDAGSGSSNAGTTPAPSGPAPGVTDDTVEVGVTYVDAESLQASGITLDLGDMEGAYSALVDQVNADGGIAGRQVELVFAPIDPTSTAPAEEACVRLTEDEDVFLVMGFFLAEASLCPVSVHATAVIGGDQTSEQLAQAQAPWISPAPDEDLPAAVIASFAEAGLLEGTVGVYGAVADEAAVNDVVLPALEEAGVEVAETGINDAPPQDTAAGAAAVQTIAERFEAAGVDTVILFGGSGSTWPTALQDDDAYRPQLLFTDATGIQAFATNAATSDTSILEGAVAGGPYGPDQAAFETMPDCVATIEEAGVEIPAPEDVADDPDDQRFQAAFSACRDVALLQAWLDAAGEDLNYGSLGAALDAGFSVTVPGDPTERTYGPEPDTDGDPTAYLFRWDGASQELVLDE